MEIVYIGIGHKARHGKDTFAAYLAAALEPYPAIIIHWADALKVELANRNSPVPLITRITDGDRPYYGLLNKIDERYSYEIKSCTEIPDIDKLMTDRNLKHYWGSEDKDAPMLQAWGTGYRRASNENYWVERLFEGVKHRIRSHSNNKIYVIIPDTRFYNEYLAIKRIDGIYIRVQRIEPDGSLYIAGDRDKNHISETSLNNQIPDYDIQANSGDLITLENLADSLATTIKKRV